jgi:hypothetical protein
MAVNSTQRTSSANVLQSLALLHSAFLFDQAERMAKRVQKNASAGDRAACIDTAFTLALSRPPTAEEQKLAAAFLDRQQAAHGGKGPDTETKALADLCHMLLSSNGFIHID